LKDQSAVQNAEKVLREFKPVDYDLSKWNGVVDAFEGKAVAAAKETLAKISKEESSLKETLSNIQEARPFEDLTVS
jgi:F-type H+-transporting ATPase subunit d